MTGALMARTELFHKENEEKIAVVFIFDEHLWLKSLISFQWPETYVEA